MRGKIEELSESLRAFVAQRERSMVVISSTDNEMLYVLKTLQGFDQAGGGDVYLMFPQAVPSADAYVAAVMASVRAQIAGANAVLARQGEAAWPHLPARCDDARAPLGERLWAMIRYVCERLPIDGDHRVVLGVLPLQIADREGYASVVGALLPRETTPSWMRLLRIFVRDDRAAPYIERYLRSTRNADVLLYALDLSTPALADALAREAQDTAVPAARRVQALLQLAQLDCAYARYPDALRKYDTAYRYYSDQGIVPMRALCLLGVGDVQRRLGRVPQALETYQQGLALAAPVQALPVVLNLLLAAGDTCADLRRWADAEGYLAYADALAAKFLNAYLKCDIMERLGSIRLELGRGDDAARTWRLAAELCQQIEYTARWASVLECEIAYHRQTGDDAARRAREGDLRTVRCLAERAHPPPHPHGHDHAN